MIDFRPTEKQAEILEHLRRFNLIIGGRRTGKTMLVAYLALREILLSDRNVWVVAPNRDLTKRIFDYLTNWTISNFSGTFKINLTELTIRNTVTNSLLELKTALEPASLKGKGLDLLIIDEAGDIPEDIWQKYLRANIAEKRKQLGGEKGRAIIIGNAPVTGTWFHKLYTSDDEDKFSFHLPTAVENEGNLIASNNPDIITLEELRSIKNSTTERTWRTEYLAEILSGEGQVFRNIEACITSQNIPGKNFFSTAPLYGHRYIMGVDLGRKQDWTVISIFDRQTFSLVYYDRFNKIDWDFQRLKILNTWERYFKPLCVLDTTGLGDVIENTLQRAGMNILPFNFTNESKKDLVEKLALMIEKGDIRFPNIPELISELESFEFKYSKTGRITYGAPAGLHDDIVLSLALAVWDLPMLTAAAPVDLLGRWKEFKSQDFFTKMAMLRDNRLREMEARANQPTSYL